MTALNPNHPVTRQVAEHWHKLCALAVHRAGGHIVITSDDIHEITGMAIQVQELHDGLHLRLISMQEAERLAREQGGMLQ